MAQRMLAFVSLAGKGQIVINVIHIANVPIKISLHAFFPMNATVNQIQWIQKDCVFTKI